MPSPDYEGARGVVAGQRGSSRDRQKLHVLMNEGVLKPCPDLLKAISVKEESDGDAGGEVKNINTQFKGLSRDIDVSAGKHARCVKSGGPGQEQHVERSSVNDGESKETGPHSAMQSDAQRDATRPVERPTHQLLPKSFHRQLRNLSSKKAGFFHFILKTLLNSLADSKCHQNLAKILLLFLLLPTSSAELDVKKTAQKLSDRCYEELKNFGECPTYNKWKQINPVCCGDYPENFQLHCRQAEVSGFVTWILPACLETIIVQNGSSIEIQVNSSNQPFLVKVPCAGWDSLERPSYSIIVPCSHVHPKIDCNAGEGAIWLCSGGGHRDDKCICDPYGYEPGSYDDAYHACWTGWTGSDPVCPCKLKHCPDGYTRNITITQNTTCDALHQDTPFNYTCIPENQVDHSKSNTSTPFLSHTNTSKPALSSSTPTTHITSSAGGSSPHPPPDDHNTKGVLIGSLVIAMFFLLFVIFVFFMRCKTRCPFVRERIISPTHPVHTSLESASSSSEQLLNENNLAIQNDNQEVALSMPT